MKRDLALVLALLLSFAQAPAQTPAPQQQPQPSQTPSPEADSGDDVVRITSNLVQFDAVVTDRQGRLVTDLRPEDFEVFVGGRKQELTNFSFVLNETRPASEEPSKKAAPDRTAPPLPPVRLKPGQVRRTIALVVDDLGTSFEDIVYVRRALKKFVDEQMQPGDLVAIMRTGAGMGALQQFTTDKQLLYRAIERVRWNPNGRAGVSAFEPIESKKIGEAEESNDIDADDRGKLKEDLAEFRKSIFTVGTLGALNYIIRGLSELPGRKSVLVFSDGFTIFPKGGGASSDSQRVLEALRRLTDQANRASVVIYTMDARGLPTLGISAADSVGGSPAAITAALNSRTQEFAGNKEGLAYLAEQTGGLFIHNTNDIPGGVRRVLDDQKGYYLIGFRPSEEVFRPAVGGRTRFNEFEVKLRRPGLNVRTRAGFYGVAEGARKPAPQTRHEQLLAALTTPLASGELSLRLTSLFSSPEEKTAYVDSLMHIDASQLRLTDEADGWKKVVIDVAAVVFGENGQAVDEINRTETVRARGDALQLMLSEGLVYMMKVPIRKPGAYQLRVAVRDSQTNKVGSASQFIDVPDLGKRRLALSGLVISAAVDETAPGAASAQKSDGDPLRDATVRRFRRDSRIDVFYHIYNAKVDRATGRPRLSTQTRIFRDGRPVFTGPLSPFDPGPQTDAARLKAGSRLRLGGELTPGDYVLQVVVTDQLTKGDRATATQWLDFEIVK